MQVLYRGKFIKSVNSKQEAKEFIEEYKKEINNYYEPMIDEADRLEKEIKSLRPVKLTESYEAYNDFVKAKYPDLFSRLENLGKQFFKEDYISTYVYNPEKHMYGWVLKDGDTETMDTLTNIGLEICVHLAIDGMFEIR